MPDVISDTHTINLNQMEDFMEDDVNSEHLLGHHLLSSPHSPGTSNMHNLNNLTNLNNLNINGQNHMTHHQNHHQHHNNVLGLVGDPMLSSSSANQQSTVDISCMDPMILNARSLLSTPQPSNCDNSILQSDSDSLASVDMDTMVA